MDKCRNCERLKVKKVNKDYTRGRGTCSICKHLMDPRQPNKIYKVWHQEERPRCFSELACKYFIPRVSTLEIGEGESPPIIV